MKDIDELYDEVFNTEGTEARMQVFENYGYPLPDIDNYDIMYGNDPAFALDYHRWLYLFQLTTGVERASVMSVAFELHRSTSNPHLLNTGFFSHSFSDASRHLYYAKAMCIVYRDMMKKD